MENGKFDFAGLARETAQELGAFAKSEESRIRVKMASLPVCDRIASLALAVAATGVMVLPSIAKSPLEAAAAALMFLLFSVTLVADAPGEKRISTAGGAWLFVAGTLLGISLAGLAAIGAADSVGAFGPADAAAVADLGLCLSYFGLIACAVLLLFFAQRIASGSKGADR